MPSPMISRLRICRTRIKSYEPLREAQRVVAEERGTCSPQEVGRVLDIFLLGESITQHQNIEESLLKRVSTNQVYYMI